MLYIMNKRMMGRRGGEKRALSHTLFDGVKKSLGAFFRSIRWSQFTDRANKAQGAEINLHFI